MSAGARLKKELLRLAQEEPKLVVSLPPSTFALQCPVGKLKREHCEDSTYAVSQDENDAVMLTSRFFSSSFTGAQALREEELEQLKEKEAAGAEELMERIE